VTSARELVGVDDDHLTLAVDDCELPAPVEVVWELLEGDHQERFLRALAARRFAGREVLELLPDGYRCRTTSRVRLGRKRSFDSVVWLDPPHRSVELQIGERTDLRYTMTYQPTAGGTLLRCEQAYRAKRTSFESGAAVGALHQRAAGVVAQRLSVARRLVEGGG
jgi:hypothetical protein